MKDLLVIASIAFLLTLTLLAFVRLIAAAFSAEVRRKIWARPWLHLVWFGVSVLCGWLFWVARIHSPHVPHTNAKAQVECMQLSAAIQMFYVDYARFPLQGTNNTDHLYQTDYTQLLGALAARGSGVEDNPNRRIFIELWSSGTGNAPGLDPWGRPLHVLADWSGDGQVTVGKELVKAPVAIWSNGPNQKNDFGRADDIRSW